MSSLDSRTSTDSIIQLLWNYHKRFENRALGCIENLMSLVIADEDIAEYVSKLPSYDYSMARFTDFSCGAILPHVLILMASLAG